MSVKERLLKEVKNLDETSARWMLGLIQTGKEKQIKKRLLKAAGKGIFQVPLRINAHSVEPIKGKGKLLSEIVLGQR